MTNEQITELLTHPRVRAYIERVALDAAMQAIATLPPGKAARPHVRPAAVGDLNYADAAHFIGCPKLSVRTYVSRRELDRGQLRGTVTCLSVERFKRTYRPAK